MHKYNVAIPQDIIELLKRTVKDFDRRLLWTIHFAEEEEGDIELSYLRMKDLKTLDENLQQFLTPIVDLLEFLVHFSIHRSHMFSQYLQDMLLQQQSSDPVVPTAPSRASVASSVFAGLEDVISDPDQESTAEGNGQTMDVSILSVAEAVALLMIQLITIIPLCHISY